MGRRETGRERSEGSDIKMKGGKRIGERKETVGEERYRNRGPILKALHIPTDTSIVTKSLQLQETYVNAISEKVLHNLATQQLHLH